jgi:PIN domain nuclease of toxin-antitoxin system
VRVLLDTAALIFAVQAPERLSKKAVAALAEVENIRELSAISLTEIAVKTTLGKLDLSVAQIEQAEEDLHLRFLPFTAEHAFRLFGMPVHHRDPFDRQIIAQALVEDIPVVTPDKRFASYVGLRVIW